MMPSPTETMAARSALPAAEVRWLPLRLLADVTASPLDRYPARHWSGSLAAEMRHALADGAPDALIDIAAALAWGLHDMTPWKDLHLEGLVRESMISALAAVESLRSTPGARGSAGWDTAAQGQADLEAALDNLKSVFAYIRQKDRDVAPLVFLFLSLVAGLCESEPRFVDLSLRTLRDLGASARLRSEALDREANAILLADTTPDAQRKREADWATRPDGAAREAAFWKYEVEKSRRKSSLTTEAATLRTGAEATALYSEFVSRIAAARRAGHAA